MDSEEDEKTAQQHLKTAITERQVFRYSYWRGFCMAIFGSPWCCCCRWKRKRQDWLQKDAKKKLNREIDILEIIKKLRVAYFASELALKPRQRWLVSFFHDYQLESDNEIESFKRVETLSRMKVLSDKHL